jgi:hypothetical protein
MLSDLDIEAAHPDAFDFVFGNLPLAKRPDFNLHLTGCRHCQAVVDEYSEIGGIIQQLPPHVEPPAELEDRIVDAMGAALAEQRAEPEPPSDAEEQGTTRVYPISPPSAVPDTHLQPRPQLRPPAEREARFHPSTAGQPAPADAEPQDRALVTHLPVWGRPRARLAALAVAAAAIIIAALVVIPNLGGGRLNPAQATVAVSLHATTAAKLRGDGAASGRATAHQAGPSWTFQMTVHGLKVLPDNNDVYECWWVGPGSNKAHPQFVSGGTFVVDKSGSATVTMTTGIDPTEFRTMEVTAESPGTGALQGAVLLIGHTL